MNIAVILAGGVGRRMMKPTPKQFLLIKGKPIIVHTIEKFCDCVDVDKILVVCVEKYIEYFRHIVDEYDLDKVEWIVEGGQNRHQSILKGLLFLEKLNLDNVKVIIHNANMPLVTEINITNCISECKEESDIATTVSRCSGYFYEMEEDALKIGPDREKILGAKVPEVCFLKTALEIYEKPNFDRREYESYTTGMLGILDNRNVIPVVCESTNMKITTEDDYRLVGTYLDFK